MSFTHGKGLGTPFMARTSSPSRIGPRASLRAAIGISRGGVYEERTYNEPTTNLRWAAGLALGACRFGTPQVVVLVRQPRTGEIPGVVWKSCNRCAYFWKLADDLSGNACDVSPRIAKSALD